MNKKRSEHEVAQNEGYNHWIQVNARPEYNAILVEAGVIFPKIDQKKRRVIESFLLEVVALFPGDFSAHKLFLTEAKRRLDANENIDIFLSHLLYVLREAAAVGFPSIGIAFGTTAQQDALRNTERSILSFGNILGTRTYVADIQVQAREERTARLKEIGEDLKILAKNFDITLAQMVMIYKATQVLESTMYGYMDKVGLEEEPHGVITLDLKSRKKEAVYAVLHKLDIQFIRYDNQEEHIIFLYINNDTVVTALRFMNQRKASIKETFGSMIFAAKGKVTDAVKLPATPGYHQRQGTAGVFLPDYQRAEKLLLLGEFLGRRIKSEMIAGEHSRTSFYDRNQTALELKKWFEPFNNNGQKTCAFLEQMLDRNFRMLCEQAIGLPTPDIVALVSVDLI